MNETLSDLGVLDTRFEQVGAPSHLRATWFASTLRDGFALTAAGAYRDFAPVARAVLREILANVPALDRSPQDAAAFILEGMTELPLHADVRPGLQRLHAAGFRLVTLTNGAAETTRDLLERGGAARYIEAYLSVADVGRWKPAPDPYRYAAERCRVAPAEVMLAAVHPWDVDGGRRAGLASAWINRDGGQYPEHFNAPDLTCRDLVALGEAL